MRFFAKIMYTQKNPRLLESKYDCHNNKKCAAISSMFDTIIFTFDYTFFKSMFATNMNKIVALRLVFAAIGFRVCEKRQRKI